MGPLLSYDQALKIVHEHSWVGDVEEVALLNSKNRRLSQGFVARYDSPPFANSSMDGFAVGGAEGPWQIVDEIRAGGSRAELRSGEAARIFTGAMIPIGTFAVIPQEECSWDAALLQPTEVKEGRCIRKQGEEFLAGTPLVAQGTRVTQGVISAFAAQGVSKVKVLAKPKVAILATGSEFTASGNEPVPGTIFESNTFALAAILSEFGILATTVHVGEDFEATKSGMEMLLREHDLLITVGGASVGEYDFVKPCAAELDFKILFSGVALKPGKPTTMGVREDGKTWFGLPGNPMSAITTCCLFVLEFLGFGLEFQECTLSHDLSRTPGREEFAPALRQGALLSTENQVGSHATAALIAATGLLRIPADAVHLAAGSKVLYADFPW